MNTQCRYIKCGLCTLSGEICTNCGKELSTVKYTYSYNPFTDTTRISIVSRTGKPYMSCELCGQLTPIAIKSYATDLCKILLDKGVMK